LIEELSNIRRSKTLFSYPCDDNN